ncbi:hypothetical protein NWP10_06355 [Micrococcus sp. HG099]|uniref:hypothetical protein n=1 Tax=Micrococcus sp. HG099 TaxID=2969755 RepID=UPI00215AAD8A|nr:hypothetical protein [Micrococcus sp. HG099]MCR8675421.1 hypothetical protein [Micrococcus sp. HG099]
MPPVSQPARPAPGVGRETDPRSAPAPAPEEGDAFMGDHQGALDGQIHHEVDVTGPIPVFRPGPGASPGAPP